MSTDWCVPSSPEWLMAEARFDPKRAPHWETLFTLCNGYAGLRGSSELSPLLGDPGLYIAGVYDGTGRFTDEIVNLPLPLGIGANVDGFELDLRKGRILTYRRVLDMRQGILFTDFIYEDAIRRQVRYESARLVHATHKHLVLIFGRLTALDRGDGLQLRSTIDAWATRHGSSSRKNHLQGVDVADLGHGISLSATMKASGITVAQVAQLRVKAKATRRVATDDDRIEEVFSMPLQVGRPLAFEKRVVLWTSRDGGCPAGSADRELQRLAKCSVRSLVASHVRAWGKVWDAADVRIEGDARAQKGIRFGLFHLSSLANRDDAMVSVGAKGLHGNGYNGQVFWDTEIYLVPFFMYTDPRTARTLLEYRYNFLKDARANAADLAATGVHFPWNSSSLTAREIAWRGWQEHLNADIAWAVDHYVRATGDREFLLGKGARLILETAAYWPSRLEFDDERGQYVMRKLTGPDELHHGIDNNTTTNYLAQWHLRRAVALADELKQAGLWKQMAKASRITDAEVTDWARIADRIYINYNARRGFHEQFDGYFQRKECMIDRSMTKMQYTGPVQASFRPTKVAQQADVMMMYHLFPNDFPDMVKRKGYLYYEPRCSHTSTLSRSVFAAVAARGGLPAEAHRLFVASLETDYGPTAECGSGIHAACLGGNWQAVVMGFAGFAIRDGRPSFDPRLPPKWRTLAFRLKWRGRTLDITIRPKSITLRVSRGKLTVAVRDAVVHLSSAPTTVLSGEGGSRPCDRPCQE